MHLLLVEDNSQLTELIVTAICEAGWSVDFVSTETEARSRLTDHHYDLLVTDLGLPDGDGLRLIRDMREKLDATPILIITARTAVEERVDALDLGADDYVTKPFQREELIARCRAVVRRGRRKKPVILSFGNILYDPIPMEYTIAGRVVHMTRHAHVILELLLEDAGRVVLRQRIEDALSSMDVQLSGNALDQEMSRLRKRLAGANANCRIETVRGIGNMLRGDIT